MSAGAFGFRVAPTGWRPKGWTPPAGQQSNAMITPHHVHLNQAWGTPQFWLIWGVLCLNVTAGIARDLDGEPDAAGRVRGQAARHRVRGSVDSRAKSRDRRRGGRACWIDQPVQQRSAASSGRRCPTRSAARTPTTRSSCSASSSIACCRPGDTSVCAALFVASICIILTMYGGGFATVPAYLADIFGTQMVGAIHGRLITAWSAAGVIGPAVIAESASVPARSWRAA